MSTSLTLGNAVLLLIVTATGYAVATLGMKLAAGQTTPSALALIVFGLAAAAIAEIFLLRGSSMAVIYFGILAAESLLILAFALAIGDQISFQQLAGAALVLGGIAMVATPH